ncbi:MAG: YunG family protein [Geminicoccaceae bacterium]
MEPPFERSDVHAALERSWSKASARQWRRDNPALGQCNVTALLVHELYGGEILKTPLSAGDHFYNRIHGDRLDFTASQFDRPIAYADLPSCRNEAFSDVAEAEYAALKLAFLKVIGYAD